MPNRTVVSGLGRQPGSVYRRRESRDNGEHFFDAAEFGRLVRLKIAATGLTVAKAAVVIGMDRCTLNRIAGGFPPTVQNHFRLKHWLEEGVTARFVQNRTLTVATHNDKRPDAQ